MENNHEISVTPLTDDEIKEFNEQVKHAKLLPVRDALKDILRVIKLTAMYFYHHHMPEAKNTDTALSVDDLIDAVSEAIDTAIMNVDEMDDAELVKIKEHPNVVSDAYRLVEMYLPEELVYDPRAKQIGVGCFNPHEKQEVRISPRIAYLKKVFDIYQILCTPTANYKGSDIGYKSTAAFKDALEEYPGGKVISRIVLPIHAMYDLPHHEITQQPVLWFSLEATIGGWVDENLDDDRHEFYDFVTKHAYDVADYMELHHLSCALSREQNSELCAFFYRWFLKEQASK